MRFWKRLEKILLPYGVLFGGITVMIFALPPLQYIGIGLYLVAIMYATLETHFKYHPRKKD